MTHAYVEARDTVIRLYDEWATFVSYHPDRYRYGLHDLLYWCHAWIRRGLEDLRFNEDGYDSDGYDRDGYNRDGYNRNGVNRETGVDDDGYDDDGYNEDGYDRDGYNEDGYDRDGYNEDGYNDDGYDCAGYDRDGYDRDGYNEDGYDCDGYDRSGYDRYGYDRDGYNEDGYDCDGYDRSGHRAGMADYHGSDRSHWTDGPGWIGVELECRAPDRQSLARSLPRDWLAERDGSLHPDEGIELIGPPTAPDQAVKAWAPVLAAMKVHDARAWDAGCGYGIHVNVSRTDWPLRAQGRFVQFIHNNRKYVEGIAGRKENEWALYSAKDASNALAYNGKYEAVHIKNLVLEVRIFRATYDPIGFAKCIEFVQAVRDWTMSLPENANLTSTNFVAWLKATHESQYANLKAWKGGRALCAY